jgi:hypothetical protein
MNLKKNGKLFTSKFVGTGPSSYEKRIYWAAVSQRLRNTAVEGPLLGYGGEQYSIIERECTVCDSHNSCFGTLRYARTKNRHSRY